MDAVLHDVRLILGSEKLGVHFIDDDAPLPLELNFLSKPRVVGQRDCDAYLFVRDESSGANGFDLDFWSTLPSEEVMARVASAAQSLVMERSVYFGQSFPPCPDHPEPLWPEVVNGGAVWRCTKGGDTVVRVGKWPA
jgi:hypothetical protein